MSQENENTKGGWIKLYRELIDKPIWINSTLEQRVILITLLCMASHEPKKWEWKGKPYEIQPGQFITSVASLVQKCDNKEITSQKVRTALKRFENLEFLTTKTTNKNTLVTIVNWGKYQDYPNENNKQNNKHLTNGQQTDNKRVTTIKNIKNNKNNKEYKDPCTIYTEDFNTFWAVYPKKTGKGEAFKAFQKINPDTELLNIMLNAVNTVKQSEQWQREQGRYIPNPSTWLNQRRWEDEPTTIISHMNIDTDDDDKNPFI